MPTTRVRSILSALPLFVMPNLCAQPASYALFGTDCTTGRLLQGIGPVPLSVRGVPRIGASFEVVTESSASYPTGQRRQVSLLTGFSNTSAGGAPLPFDLASLAPGQPYCGLLYTSVEVRTPVPAQPSYTVPSTVRITLPNVAALAGLRFYQQVLSIESSTFGPPFLALALSRGGQGTVGF